MFPGSPSQGGSLTHPADPAAICFATLIRAAQKGTIADVVEAIDALEKTATPPIENSKLIAYITNLQDNNQIFTASLCWFALLTKSIAQAKKHLKALTNDSIEGLEEELIEYKARLERMLAHILKEEKEIATLDTQHGEEIQLMRRESAEIERKIRVNNIDIGHYRCILDWEERYQTNDKDLKIEDALTNSTNDQSILQAIALENTLEPEKLQQIRIQRPDQLPKKIKILFNEIIGQEINVSSEVSELKAILSRIRTHLDNLKLPIDRTMLEQVNRRKFLIENIEKLQDPERRVYLLTDKLVFERTKAEIKEIEQTLKRHKMAGQLQTMIKRGAANDEAEVYKALTDATNTDFILDQIKIDLNCLTNNQFEEFCAGKISPPPTNEELEAQKLFESPNPLERTSIPNTEQRKILSEIINIFLPSEKTSVLLQHPLYIERYLSQVQITYEKYINAKQKSQRVTIDLRQAWENIKHGTSYLQRLSSPSLPQQHSSVAVIQDMMWDTGEDVPDKLSKLQQAKQQGCIVAKIYLAERDQDNDDSAYTLAEILEAQAPQYQTTKNQRNARIHWLAQALLAHRKNNSSQAAYFNQLALTRNIISTETSDIELEPIDFDNVSSQTLNIHERWNIINQSRKISVIQILAERTPSNTDATLTKLYTAVASGSVAAALCWKIFQPTVDLISQGKIFQSSQNFSAAAACWIAALKQKNTAAAIPLVSLLDQYYPNYWIDNSTNTSYCTHLLAQGLIQYFCDNNKEGAKRSYQLAIENNSLAAVFYLLLLERGESDAFTSDNLIKAGVRYRNQEDFTAAIAYFRAAMILNNPEAADSLSKVFSKYDCDNFWIEANSSCSKNTVAALKPMDIPQLEKAAQNGSMVAAIYLAQINKWDAYTLTAKGKHYFDDKQLAAAGAYWLAAIEQGEIGAAFFLISNMPNQSISESNHPAIERALALQKQKRFVAAAAYFGGALKHGIIIADYLLANMLQNFFQQWQAAAAANDVVNSTKLSALYQQIMQRRNHYFHLESMSYSPSTSSNTSPTAMNIDIASAEIVIYVLYKNAYDHGVSTKDSIASLIESSSNRRNSEALKEYTRNITDVNERYSIAQQYETQWRWASGANTLALKHYTHLATSNFLPAIFKLIQVHMLGELGLPINYVEAGKYITQIDNLNQADAWLQLAKAFALAQYGLPYSTELANDYYKKAAAGDKITAQELVVSQLHDTYINQLQEFETNINTPHVFFVLAQLYDELSEAKYSSDQYDPDGLLQSNFRKNQLLARSYYQLAALGFDIRTGASEAHPDACKKLAEIYEKGLLGVTKDQATAAAYQQKFKQARAGARYTYDSKNINSFTRPISKGNSELIYLLARQYEQGNEKFGIKRDFHKSSQYYQQAAKLGHPFALIKLIIKTKKPKPNSIEPDLNNLATYETQLDRFTNPEVLFFLSHKTIECARDSANNDVKQTAQKAAEIYYACAVELNNIKATRLSAACARYNLATLSIYSNQDRTKRQELAAQAGHPQNVLMLGHLYEHTLGKPDLALQYYHSILQTPIDDAAKRWSVKNKEPTVNAQAVTTQPFEHIYGLAAFRIGQFYEANKERENAKIYYCQASGYNNVDACLRLGQAIAKNEEYYSPYYLARDAALKYYLRAFTLFPDAYYKSTTAYLMFGLALENDIFDLYQHKHVTEFLKRVIEENNIDTAELLAAVAQQENGKSSIYLRPEGKKIAALFKKIAANHDNIDAVLDLDELNDPRYLPSNLYTPDLLLKYYQNTDNKDYYPVNMRLGQLHDASVNANSPTLPGDTFDPGNRAEAQRYYAWINYLGLQLKPIKFFSSGSKHINCNLRVAINYYTKASVDSRCIQARMLLTGAFLFGLYDTEPDYDTGRECYQEMMRSYNNAAPRNTFEIYFGLSVVPRTSTDYHSSPLAQQEGWTDIYVTSRIILANSSTQPEHLSPQQLFTLAQYHTILSKSTIPAISTSSIATPANSRDKSIRTPGSESVFPNRQIQAPIPSPASPGVYPPARMRPHSASETSGVFQSTPLTQRQSLRTRVYTTLARRSSTASIGSGSSANDVSRPASATPFSSQPSNGSAASGLSQYFVPIRSSGATSASVTRMTACTPWQSFLISLSEQQQQKPNEDLIEWLQNNMFAKRIYIAHQLPNKFLHFPPWETPPEDAEQKSLWYYKIAAEKNYAPAIVVLFIIYLLGLLGESADLKIAEEYYSRLIALAS